MTIRSRLIIALSLCLAFALSSICAIIFFYVSASEEDHFREQAISHLGRVEESINTFLEPGAMSVSYLAGIDLVRISYGNLSSYLDTTSPNRVVHQHLTHYEQLVYDEFIRVVRSNKNYKNIYLGNRDGQYTEAPEGRDLPAGFDPRLTPWYQEALASDQHIVYSSPYRSMEGEMVCSIMAKASELDDAFLGVLGVDYSLESLTAYLSKRKILQTGYLVMLDRSGDTLADGDDYERIYAHPGASAELWLDLARSPDGEFYGINGAGRDKYIVTHTISNLGWKLAVVFDRDELMTSSYELLRWILLCAVVLFCVVSVVGVLLARSLARPMEELASAAKIISAGEYEFSGALRVELNKKLAVRAGGETGELADALRTLIYTLQQRVDSAELANRAKTEFMANMSHELRTPMNAIIGLMNILLKSGLNEKQQDYASKVKAAATSLLRSINDILDFSQIERGTMQMEQGIFNLRVFLESTRAAYEQQSRSSGIALTLEQDPDLPEWVNGDPLRLRQVFDNTIGNSFKFTNEGSIGIKAEVAERSEGRVKVRFSVIDTGIGIPPEKKDNVFDPFLQGDATPTRKYGGTGLGLALVKNLVGLMQGEVAVRSKHGEGTTVEFTITFDLAPADYASAEGQAWTVADKPEPAPAPAQPEPLGPVAETTAPASPAPTAKAEEERSLRGFSVLLVEDNVVNTQIAVELMEEMGLTVYTAAHGGEALAAVDAAFAQGSRPPFDIILMDLQMPVMDGYESARRLLSNPAYKDLRIIAITAHALNEDRERCQDIGMVAHVSKPIDALQLRETLEYFLLGGPLPNTLL